MSDDKTYPSDPFQEALAVLHEIFYKDFTGSALLNEFRAHICDRIDEMRAVPAFSSTYSFDLTNPAISWSVGFGSSGGASAAPATVVEPEMTAAESATAPDLSTPAPEVAVATDAPVTPAPTDKPLTDV